MKFLLSCLIYLVAPVSYAQSQSSVDWSAVNASLVNVVQNHVDHFEFIEAGHIRVDETKSDLSNGALSLDFNFDSTELYLLSSVEPQRMSVTGNFDLNTVSFGQNHKVDFSATIELKGDLLAILNHINQIFIDCSALDPADTFMTLICDYEKEVTQAKNAADLLGAVSALRDALVTLFESGTPNEYKDFIEQLNIVEHAGSIIVSNLVNDLTVFGFNISGEVGLTFSDTGVKLQVAGSTLLNSTDYSKFISLMESVFIGIQTEDPNILPLATNYSYFVFELLEGIFL